MPLVTYFPLSPPHSSRLLCPPALSPQVQLQAKSHAAVDHMGSDWLRLFEGDAMACTISSLRAGCTYRARVSAWRGGGGDIWHEVWGAVAGPPLHLQEGVSGQRPSASAPALCTQTRAPLLSSFLPAPTGLGSGFALTV